VISGAKVHHIRRTPVEWVISGAKMHHIKRTPVEWVFSGAENTSIIVTIEGIKTLFLKPSNRTFYLNKCT
jgi:hypothetical protein